MKITRILAFLLSLVVAAAGNSIEIDSDKFINSLKLQLEGLKVDLPEGFVEFIAELDDGNQRAGGIVAVVNDYVDRIMVNIKSAILRYGLDPMSLPNTTLSLIPTGTIDLYSGWLQDTSTLTRNGDVAVTYSSATKKMELNLPIKFDSLLFTYKYHTQVLILGISGDTDGKLSSVKVNVKLSFNYANYQVSLDTFDITDSGKISLKFTGNGLVDWLTNMMTSVVSLFLQPLIIRIVQALVEGGLDSVVDAINDLIKSILS